VTVPAPPILPWIPPAVRVLLLADAEFTAACGGRCVTRLPSDMTKPVAQLRATAIPIDVSAGAWSPMVQVDGWCAPGGPVDPEQAAWRVAVAASRVLARARNVAWENIHYKARVTDGPLTDIDTARGLTAPLYRAFIRAELIVHAH
jgi:hypothetical protein